MGEGVHLCVRQVCVHLATLCVGLCVSLSELMRVWGGGALFCPLPVLSCGPPPFSCSERLLVVGWAGQAHCRLCIASREACLCSCILTCFSQHPPFHSPILQGSGWLRVTLRTVRSVRQWAMAQLVGAAKHREDSAPRFRPKSPLTLAPQDPTESVGVLQRAHGGPPRVPHPPVLSPSFLSPWVFPVLSEAARWLGGHMTLAVWS